MPLLPNPPENPCFGCGPSHARGLHLGFERTWAPDGADEVRCAYTPRDDECGWPGLLHTGLHFLVMYETSYWAAWELSGKVSVGTGQATFGQPRLPRAGKPFVARARLVAPPRGDEGAPPGSFAVRCVTEGLDGKPLGSLDSRWTHPSRAALERAGKTLPDYILRDMAP